MIVPPQRLKYLNTWALVSGIVWEELGGVALLEEVYHWARLLKLLTVPPTS